MLLIHSVDSMMNFCTLFDSGYLQRGLALYDSLCRSCDEFHLYIMAFDDKSYEILINLKLPSLTVVNLRDFEDERLLAVKPTRTRAEYCWTSGPSVIYYFITHYRLDACTYLDADLMFYRSPQILFDEIGTNSVAITDHYAPYEIPAGRYCVQFMYFKNDERGMKALTWWRDKCIEWCYAHFEEGKYGDQKYLEQFPVLFEKVHIIKTRGAGIASWNMDQYSYDSDNWRIYYKGEAFDIIFVHYHALSMEIADNRLILTPCTFDIHANQKYIFDYYASMIVDVCKKYLEIKVDNYAFKSRTVYKRYLEKVKFLFRDVKIIRFLYERYFRPEYKGYDKKLIVE